MANVNIQKVYDWKAQKFTGGSPTNDFAVAFQYALERLVDDLNSEAVGLSGIAVPVDMEHELVLDNGYLGNVCDIIDYYLQETGQWGSDDKGESRVKYLQAIRSAHTAAHVAATQSTGIGTPDDDSAEDDEDITT